MVIINKMDGLKELTASEKYVCVIPNSMRTIDTNFILILHSIHLFVSKIMCGTWFYINNDLGHNLNILLATDSHCCHPTLQLVSILILKRSYKSFLSVN